MISETSTVNLLLGMCSGYLRHIHNLFLKTFTYSSTYLPNSNDTINVKNIYYHVQIKLKHKWMPYRTQVLVLDSRGLWLKSSLLYVSPPYLCSIYRSGLFGTIRSFMTVYSSGAWEENKYNSDIFIRTKEYNFYDQYSYFVRIFNIPFLPFL